MSARLSTPASLPVASTTATAAAIPSRGMAVVNLGLIALWFFVIVALLRRHRSLTTQTE